MNERPASVTSSMLLGSTRNRFRWAGVPVLVALAACGADRVDSTLQDGPHVQKEEPSPQREEPSVREEEPSVRGEEPSVQKGSPTVQKSNGVEVPACYRDDGGVAVKTASGALVVTLGSGPKGIVLAPISYGDACEWQVQARWLAKRGYRVATLSWGAGRAPSIRDAANEVRTAGATSLVLVGACAGGTAALGLATQLTPPPEGIVAVSPLVSIAGASIGEDFAQYRNPVLLIGTDRDPLTPTAALRDIERMRPDQSRTVIYSGSQHGVEIFNDPVHGGPAQLELQRFLERVLP